MDRSEAQRWDRRYQSRDKIKIPHSLLQENRHLLPKQGLALDLATGEGQNSDYLQKAGLKVVGIDFSIIALRMAKKKNPQVNLFLADLNRFLILPERFDVILNFYYLNRDLFPQIIQGLRPGGILFFETFTKEMGRIKPSIRPEHLLEKNELLQAFETLQILFYEECRLVKKGNRVKYVARLIAKKPV